MRGELGRMGRKGDRKLGRKEGRGKAEKGTLSTVWFLCGYLRPSSFLPPPPLSPTPCSALHLYPLSPPPQSLVSILKKPGVRKKPFLVKSIDDALLASRMMGAEALAPIFLTSAVTGAGLDLVRAG